MAFIYRKAKMRLNFQEGKPTVFKAQQVILPQVSTDELIDEISQSCGVNPAQTHSVILSLENRLIHYISIGHPVRIGVLGSLNPKFRSKCTKTSEEATAETVTRKVIQFIPGKGLKECIAEQNIKGYDSLDVEG
ncbi:MAG: HU family DNA-binding protein [Prevotellaceae bacterium]|nr:HU family DNA-binding protein [Candidatus Minthosoma equi]